MISGGGPTAAAGHWAGTLQPCACAHRVYPITLKPKTAMQLCDQNVPHRRGIYAAAAEAVKAAKAPESFLHACPAQCQGQRACLHPCAFNSTVLQSRRLRQARRNGDVSE
eukprot:364053-Chlamydomonas_euryale.AAC.6